MTQDTICAISTPAGCGGIAVIRVSGPEAIGIVDGVWRGRRLTCVAGHTAHLGRIEAGDGSVLDQGVATVYRAPASFTGEDVVELSVHGSPYIQQALLELLCGRGCRLAQAGEFTRRAFAAGKLDLAQAEAVADVIASESAAAHRVAMTQMRGGFSRRLGQLRGQLLELASLLELELDFAEEDVEFADRSRLEALAVEVKSEVDRLHGSFALGNVIKNGVPVAIVGAPNVGKSSILNLLLGEGRAIVSDIPGTTRDTIEDTAVIDGVTFRFIDTAGLRVTDDPIERQGVERAMEALRRARVVLDVVAPGIVPDAGYEALTAEALPADATVVRVLNKADLLPGAPEGAESRLLLSARTGQGTDMLRQTLVDASGAGALRQDNVLVTNVRHAQALAQASASLDDFLTALRTSLPSDLAAQDLRQALHHLGTITGTVTTPDILANIFARFCIGK